MIQLCKYFVLAISPFMPDCLYAQAGHYKNGAGTFSRADASVTESDEWSLFNNAGALADREQNISIVFSSRNYYSVPDMFSAAAGINCPVRTLNTALGFFRFGNDLFSEQSIIFGLGHKIGHTSIGGSLHYLQILGEQIGKGECLAISFGGITRITRELTIGAYIFNLNQAKLSQITGEKLPTVMNMGVAYKTNGGVKVNIEVEKEIDFKMTVRSGIEYAYRHKFFIRSGIMTTPFSGSFGIGLETGRFLFDYGLRGSGILGISQMVSVVFRIKKR